MRYFVARGQITRSKCVCMCVSINMCECVVFMKCAMNVTRMEWKWQLKGKAAQLDYYQPVTAPSIKPVKPKTFERHTTNQPFTILLQYCSSPCPAPHDISAKRILCSTKPLAICVQKKSSFRIEKSGWFGHIHVAILMPILFCTISFPHTHTLTHIRTHFQHTQ